MDQLSRLVNALPPVERVVLEMLYGSEDCRGEPYTLAECARTLGVSSERLRKIEADAIRRIAEPPRQPLASGR